MWRRARRRSASCGTALAAARPHVAPRPPRAPKIANAMAMTQPDEVFCAPIDLRDAAAASAA